MAEALLGLIVALVATAQPATYVARLESISAPAGAVIVTHAGRSEAALLLQPLVAGSEVHVVLAEGSATVRLIDGRRLRVCGQSGPGCDAVRSYRITVRPNNRSLFTSIRREMSLWLFAQQERFGAESTAYAIVDRGGSEEIEIPVWRPGTVFVSAGKRTLPLIWAGGAGPFTVSIDDHNAVSVHRSVTTERQVELVLSLNPGTYRGTVRDSAGHQAVVEILVSNSLRILTRDADSAMSLIAALELSHRDGGSWAWEAMARLRALVDVLPAAVGAYRAIAAGDLPPIR
jgi:hypothetical protein